MFGNPRLPLQRFSKAKEWHSVTGCTCLQVFAGLFFFHGKRRTGRSRRLFVLVTIREAVDFCLILHYQCSALTIWAIRIMSPEQESNLRFPVALPTELSHARCERESNPWHTDPGGNGTVAATAYRTLRRLHYGAL